MDQSITIDTGKVNDKKSISSIKSTKSSKSSYKSKKVTGNMNQVDSEDISLSQLELMANKKKLNKKSEDISIDPIILDKESSKLKKEDRKNNTTSINSSISSSSSSDSNQKRRKEKMVTKENKNDSIRKDKSEFLFKFNKLNVKGQWSSLRLDMNSSLDEIKNEYERVRSEIQNERSVSFFKRMLLLGVQGIEMMNTKFDPLGVDLDGWSEAMGYSMENQEYDEVMSELYEKYKGRGQMSPEVKLIFMIISSATMFTITKKITKLDSNNAFKSFLGGLMGGNKGVSIPQQQQQQQYQQQQQQQQQQQYQQQQYQQQQYQQQQYIPNPSELRNMRETTDTSDDNIPSRMNGPQNDNIDIENILKTMNDRKREKEKHEVTETSDDILKSIPIGQKRGRGRPKKSNGVSRNF